MKTLDPVLLKKFLKAAGEKLTGNWVIIGGTVLPLLNRDYRVTVDIDIVPVDDENQGGTLRLMNIAESLGLPIETINQAGGFFLHRIKGFKDKLILLHKGTKADIYRPNLELFMELKIKRFSETDHSDCVEYLKQTVLNKEKFNKKNIIKIIKSELKNITEEKKRDRFYEIIKEIGSAAPSRD